MNAPATPAGAPLTPLAITNHTLATALGVGRTATLQALREGRTGLKPQPFETADLGTWLGLVDGLDALDWPAELAAFDCRNNRLAELALRADGFEASVQAATAHWGAGRVGVFLGTSTSGILQTELAYRERDAATGALPAWLHYGETHNTYSVARYVRARLGLQGPAQVVSTACSSSAKVYATAARFIALGLVDAAIVGGVDSLCLTTLYGFKALELVSSDICRPFDEKRDGLSLGEAAAFALVERDAAQPMGWQAEDAARPMGWLLAAGESSDGHHMSSPHPQGLGAAMAMRAALAQAGLQPEDVDYLNLHGTATPGNDTAEDQAVGAVFGQRAQPLPCSSTKGFTGHTLGAAGGVEASIALLALEHGFAPAGLNLQTQDPALHSAILRAPLHTTPEQPLRVVASNSFGFGGSNACLLFGHADAFSAAPSPVNDGSLTVQVSGVGLLAPGVADWATGAAALQAPDQLPNPLPATVVPPPQRLPATERRRAGPVVKAAIVAADQALAASGLQANALATVFTSSTGEPSNCHALCESLATPERLLSPTRFTNSVHNAPGGYWHIASQAMTASTSLAAFDGSFGAGLLEAATQALTSGQPVLAVCADVTYPAPLQALRPLADTAAVALVISPVVGPVDGHSAGPRLRIRLVPEQASTGCGHAELDRVVQGIPAARALPLLAALARGEAAQLLVEGLPGHSLHVEVLP